MELMQVYKAPPKQKKDDEGQKLAVAAATMGLVAAAAPLAPALIPASVGLGAGAGAAGLGVYGMMRDKPKQPGYESNVGYSQSTVSRRMASTKDPYQDLLAAQNAVQQAPLADDEKLAYMQPINQALEEYKKRYT